MADAIRRGTIILDLVSGKHEVKAPDLSPILQARKNELALTQQLGQQQQQQARAHEEHQSQALRSSAQVAGGLLHIARAAVLVSTGSEEGFEKLIRNLALVQAGIDGLRGAQHVMHGLEAAQKAAAASGKELGLVEAFLAQSVNPVAAGFAIAAATIGAVVAVVDALNISEEEQSQINEKVAASIEKMIDARRRHIEVERQVSELRVRGLPEGLRGGRQAADLQFEMQRAERESERILDATELERRRVLPTSGRLYNQLHPENREGQFEIAPGGQAALEDQIRNVTAIADIERQNFDIAKQKIDAQRQLNAEQLRTVQLAQQELENAERAKDAAMGEVRSFELRLGLMSDFERKRSLALIEQSKTNPNGLGRNDLERLANLGGPGQTIAAEIFHKRLEAQGIDVQNLFHGVPGGDQIFKGLEDASAKLDDAADKLADAVAKFGSEAELEKKNADLTQKLDKLQKDSEKIANVLANILQRLDARVKTIEDAEDHNRRVQSGE